MRSDPKTLGAWIAVTITVVVIGGIMIWNSYGASGEDSQEAKHYADLVEKE